MDEIRFSNNWNNKLDCNAFTTIRIASKKYVVGHEYEIITPTKRFTGKVIQIKNFWLHNMNDYIAYLDTGYNTKDCTDILRRMYQTVDFQKTPLSLILIVKQ